jgi:hypothetical protein
MRVLRSASRASEKLVTIARFSNAHDAETARRALAAAGITAWFTDDETLLPEWFISPGGIVKLQVAADREDEADALLATLASPDVVTAALASPIPEGAPAPRVCPECGSSNIARMPRALTFMALAASALAVGVALDQTQAAFFVALIIGLALIFMPGSRCRDCEARW